MYTEKNENEVSGLRYEIGIRIRKYRKACGMTQEELARQIGVTKSRVSNWEQGLNRPDADILALLCRALQVSPSELLDVHLTEDEPNEHERALLRAYREKAELRHAVDILLGVDKE